MQSDMLRPLRIVFQHTAQSQQKYFQVPCFCQRSEVSYYQMLATPVGNTREFRRIGAGDDAMTTVAEFGMACSCTRQCLFCKPPNNMGMLANYSFQFGGKAHPHLIFS